MINDTPKIAILLATYNSGKFLREQIDSLLDQTYSDFTLYIRDDGSVDTTLQIVAEYCATHSNIILLEDLTKGRQAKGSFIWMLEHVDADYYMFCDHDDYWLPEKLEITFQRMRDEELKNTDKPIVVNSDLIVANNELKIINNSFWDYMKLRPDLLSKKKYLATCNFITGCTMMINQKAKEISLPMGDRALMHDAWIGLKVLNADGIISYIERPLILYRQHNSNVCGATEIGGNGYFRKKIRNLKELYSTNKKNYFMAHQATGVSPFSFILYRLLYLLKR